MGEDFSLEVFAIIENTGAGEKMALSDEVKEFLKKRNLDDKDKENFALTRLAEGMRETLSMLGEIPEGYEGKPFVLFASFPQCLEEAIDIASKDFENKAIQSGKFNLLSSDIDFLRGLRKHTTSESVRFTNSIFFSKSGEENLDNPIGYVEIFRNGYVERGLCRDIMGTLDKKSLLFNISFFAADFWAYMKFIHQLYGGLECFGETNIRIALSDTKGVIARGFRENQPFGSIYGIAQEENVLIEKSVVLSDLGNTVKMEEIVKDVVGRVTNHFDQTIGDCLDEEGKFDEDLLEIYYNRRLHSSLYIS